MQNTGPLWVGKHSSLYGFDLVLMVALLVTWQALSLETTLTGEMSKLRYARSTILAIAEPDH